MESQSRFEDLEGELTQDEARTLTGQTRGLIQGIVDAYIRLEHLGVLIEGMKDGEDRNRLIEEARCHRTLLSKYEKFVDRSAIELQMQTERRNGSRFDNTITYDPTDQGLSGLVA